MNKEPRFQQLAIDQVDDRQRPLAEQIMKVSAVGLGGPYNSLLRSPVLGQKMFDLLHYLRWQTSVPLKLNEFAILIIGRQWRSQIEWFAHAPLAEKAGVPAAAIEAIRRGETPSFAQTNEALVHRICAELFKTQRLSDASFAQAVASLGEAGLIEVIGIIGYYTLIGNTLNVFQVALPEGVTPPFPE